jgi:hypothetical protein
LIIRWALLSPSAGPDIATEKRQKIRAKNDFQTYSQNRELTEDKRTGCDIALKYLGSFAETNKC